MNQLWLMKVEPQPEYIESSGRWNWPLPPQAIFPGCRASVCSASREWWEYAPDVAKPHPFAEGVMLRDNVWYWAVPWINQDDEIAQLRAARKTLLMLATSFQGRAQHERGCAWSREACVCTCGLYELRLHLANELTADEDAAIDAQRAGERE